MVATHGSKRRRWWLWVTVGLGVVLLVLAAAGAWLAYTGIKAKNALQSAATALSNAQSALLEGDAAAADQAVTKASTLTGQARRSTSDPVWKVAGAVPLLGASPKAVTLSSQAADDVVSGALPQFVAAAKTLDISTIKAADGTVDLSRFPPAGEQLAGAQGSLREAQSLMAQVPTSGVPGFVRTGTDELTAKVDEALGVSTTASSLLKVIPGMLGQSGPQTYFVGFQSPVEIRGTGGFLGTYGILTVDKGKLTQRDTFANTTLVDPVRPSVNLGADYVNLYGADPLWSNMNMSPNFPYAGVQWANGWKVQTGQQVAGAMAIDLTALQYLIQATGPVTAPDGTVLTSDNVVKYLGNDIYIKYADDSEARKQYQSQIATDLIDRVLHLKGGTSALVKALSQSVSGGHVQMWSADQATQDVLATTPLAGQTSPAPGPYAQLVLNNGGGNKLDYYLQRKVEYTAGQCLDDGTRKSTVKVTLTNTAPADLPRNGSTVGTGDGNRDGQPDFINRTLAYVHFANGAGVTGVRVDGQPAMAHFGIELGHPVSLSRVDVAPGKPVTLEFDVIEPQSGATPRVPEQPMVLPQQTQVSWKGC